MSTLMEGTRHTRVASRTIVLIGLVALAQLPVLVLIVRALAPTWRYPDLWPDHITLDALRELVASERVRHALATSLTLAGATAVGSTLFGFLVARGLTRTRGWTHRLGAVAAYLPVVAPPIALGTGLQVLALRLGLGGSWTGVWLAHLIPATGYVAVYFSGVLDAYDTEIEDVARALGATRRQVVWRVAVPILRERAVEALWLGALVSWGQLALSLLIGGGAIRTLPVEVLVVLRAGDDRAGAAASLLLAVVPVCALVASRLRWRGAGPAL